MKTPTSVRFVVSLTVFLLSTAACTSKSVQTNQEIRQAASKEITQTIRETIEEPNRQRELWDLAQTLDRQTTELLSLRDEHQRQLTLRITDYEAYNVTIRALLDNYEAVLAPGRERILDTMLTMRASDSRRMGEDWPSDCGKPEEPLS